MDRAELIALAVRMAAAAALTMFTVRYMVKYLDPAYSQREENKKKVKELFEKLCIPEGREVSFDEHELRIALQLVGEDAGAEWDEIGGAEELIESLKDRVILPLRLAGTSRSSLLNPPSGILLYGPPGCGKTLLAKAVARAAGCRFINLQVSNLTDKWYGESQKLAAAVFSVARKLQPTIIFIDEIDSFLRDRQTHDHEATAMMKAQFMQLWDGFCSDGEQVIVMGATNRPNDVDAAILRRMPAKFMVPVPNAQQRGQILKVILREELLAKDVQLDAIAELSEGLAGSDLKEVCRMAVIRRAKIDLNKDFPQELGPRPSSLLQEDFIRSLAQYQQSRGHIIEYALD